MRVRSNDGNGRALGQYDRRSAPTTPAPMAPAAALIPFDDGGILDSF